MKKNNRLWIILNLIFLVIFNAAFFVLGGFKNNASVWISYGFIHLSYFLLLLTPFFIHKSKSEAVFGFSLYLVSSIYFIVELFLGSTYILIEPNSFKLVFVTQLCIAGLYGIILVSNLIANQHTAGEEEKRGRQIAYVKDASAKLKSISEKMGNKETRKSIEKVYDTINSSPVKSYPELAQIEIYILQLINDLEEQINAENQEKLVSLANTLLLAVNERNTQIKVGSVK